MSDPRTGVPALEGLRAELEAKREQALEQAWSAEFAAGYISAIDEAFVLMDRLSEPDFGPLLRGIRERRERRERLAAAPRSGEGLREAAQGLVDALYEATLGVVVGREPGAEDFERVKSAIERLRAALAPREASEPDHG